MSKQQLAKEEIIIQFLNDKFQKQTTNEISIYRDEIKELNFTEDEAARIIHILKTDGLLVIKNKSTHDDFSRFWVVELNSRCIHYFANKKEYQKEKQNNWIQFWIPVALSAIAIIISIIALILGV